MTPNLLDELEVVVRVLDRAGKLDYEEYADGKVVLTGPKSAIHALAASTRFLRTHHAEIADMAKRLEAAERDAARYRWLREQNATIDNPGAWTITRCDFTDADEPSRYWVGSDLDAAIDATQEGEG